VPGDSAIHDYPLDRPLPRASGIINGAPNPDRSSTQNDPWHLGEEIPRTVTPTTPTQQSSSSSIQATTLFEHASAQIDDRIAGLDPNVALPMYTTRIEETETYVRNTGFWAADVDTTCISPWNDDNRHKTTTLITPKHVLSVTHADRYPVVGSVLHFVTMGNVVVKRTVVSWTDVTYVDPVTGPHTADLRIGLLDSDLPPTITPCKVLMPEGDVKFAGAGYYFPPITEANKGVGMPYFVQNSRNDREDAQVLDIGGLYSESKYRSTWYGGSTDPTRASFYQYRISYGDSGDAACLIINGELVLNAIHQSIFGDDDVNATSFCNGMARDIDALLPVGYKLTAPDLSGFPDIGPQTAWRLAGQ
jgi:hypothetical protein